MSGGTVTEAACHSPQSPVECAREGEESEVYREVANYAREYENTGGVFPIPAIPRPRAPDSGGSRSRAWYGARLALLRLGASALARVNSEYG